MDVESLTIACAVVDCTNHASEMARWGSGLVPVCTEHLVGQVVERQVD